MVSYASSWIKGYISIASRLGCDQLHLGGILIVFIEFLVIYIIYFFSLSVLLKVSHL